MTPISVARDAGAMRFMGHACCQTYLNLVWLKHMHLNTPYWTVSTHSVHNNPHWTVRTHSVHNTPYWTVSTHSVHNTPYWTVSTHSVPQHPLLDGQYSLSTQHPLLDGQYSLSTQHPLLDGQYSLSTQVPGAQHVLLNNTTGPCTHSETPRKHLVVPHGHCAVEDQCIIQPRARSSLVHNAFAPFLFFKVHCT